MIVTYGRIGEREYGKHMWKRVRLMREHERHMWDIIDTCGNM
jgi:hypothetical protein